MWPGLLVRAKLRSGLDTRPRWSQATERLIGTRDVRRTLPFNGYGHQVRHLYGEK